MYSLSGFSVSTATLLQTAVAYTAAYNGVKQKN